MSSDNQCGFYCQHPDGQYYTIGITNRNVKFFFDSHAGHLLHNICIFSFNHSESELKWKNSAIHYFGNRYLLVVGQNQRF